MLGARVEHLAPKAASLDAISAKTGESGLRETSYELTGSATGLIEWMAVNQWIYRTSPTSPWQPFASKTSGKDGKGPAYLVKRERPARHREDRTYCQTMITPRGRAKLSELLAQGGLPLSASRKGQWRPPLKA